MQHHRRKKLCQAILKMYLDNYKRTGNWSEADTLEKQMVSVTEVLKKANTRTSPVVSNYGYQMELF